MSPRHTLTSLVLPLGFLLIACGDDGNGGSNIGPNPTAATLEPVSPVTLTVEDGIAVPRADAPSVRVLSGTGTPVGGVEVRFTVDAGPATIAGGTRLAHGVEVVTASADGIATLPTWIPAALTGSDQQSQSIVTARLRNAAGVVLDSVRFTATATGNTWSFVRVTQPELFWSRTAPFEGRLYYDDGTYLGARNLETGQILLHAPLPAGRPGASLIAYGDRLMATGGMAVETATECPDAMQACAATLLYDPRRNTWSDGAPMLEPRTDHASVHFSGSIYVLGGRDIEGGTIATVERFDPATETWTPRAPMLTPRLWPSATELNGALYAGGGIEGDVTIERYDPRANAWEVVTSTPEPLYRAGLATLHGQLYVVGNPMNGGSVSTTIRLYRWNPVTDRWAQVATPAIHRLQWEPTVMNNRLYLTGGTIGEEGTGMLVYQP